MSSSRVRRASGFALPAVLAVTGVVTLIFLVAITASANLNREVRSAQARVAFLERALTAEAVVTYAMATEPFGQRGLRIGSPRNMPESADMTPGSSTGLPEAEILFDDRPYRMELGGRVLTVRLQDQAGLINISRLDEEGLRRLARAAGVPAQDANDLAARFLDYVDQDDLRRVDGAERSDYPAGQPPPNRSLRSPDEWLSVLSARDLVDASAWRALRPNLAADAQEITSNINTATETALQVRFGLSEQQARRAIEAREERPFLSLGELAAVTGALLFDNGEGLYVYPSGRAIFTIDDGTSRWRYQGRITITPGNPYRAYWVDETSLSFRPRGETETSEPDEVDLPYPTS